MDNNRVQKILSFVAASGRSSNDVSVSDIKRFVDNRPYLLRKGVTEELIANIFTDNQNAVQNAVQTGVQTGRELERQERINTRPPSEHVLLPPKVCETAASSLDTSKPENRRKKRKYDSEILPQRLYENAFIHVKNYCWFVSGCAQAINSKAMPLPEVLRCFAGDDSFKMWCPAENEGGPKGIKRSLALCRAFGKEINRHISDVDVQHQVPITPIKEKKQDVDIAFFLQPENTTSTPIIYALLEYKPISDFPSYESQASAYATDLMSITNDPTIVIQAHGSELQSMNFRVFGIVPAELTNDTADELQIDARHRKALLYEGQGHSTLAGIASGLAECAKGVLRSDWQSIRNFNVRGKISSAASVHEIHSSESGSSQPFFFKSYDYRLRENMPKDDRRHVNLNLIHEFIDENAKHFHMGHHLDVVIVHFFEQDKEKNEWYSDFPARNLARILDDLAKVHELGYVHGDIRLFNMLLHVGKLVDFDHARRRGRPYANSLLPLSVDGKRAKVVEEAIEEETLAALEMEYEHDWESMKYVWKNLSPQLIHQRNSLPGGMTQYCPCLSPALFVNSQRKFLKCFQVMIAALNAVLKFRTTLETVQGARQEKRRTVQRNPARDRRCQSQGSD